MNLDPHTSLPSTITVELFKSPSEPVKMKELGENYLKEIGYPLERMENPLKLSIGQKTSKAGNIFFEYIQNGLPLPSGLKTLFKVEGVFIPQNQSGYSEEKHYPFRSGKADISVGNMIYVAHTYISKTMNPFYIKIVVHKKPEVNLLKKPRGGTFI